jgi:ABC-type glycerol-3-phosphate transport system substrate-binding protein
MITVKYFLRLLTTFVLCLFFCEYVSASELTFEVDAPADGSYELWVEYSVDPSYLLPPEMTLSIDGEVPGAEAKRLKFKSKWLAGEATTDRYGNEIPGATEATGERLVTPLEDSAYRISTPLLFNLTRGGHTLTFTANNGEVLIHSVELKEPAAFPAYTPGDASGGFIDIYEGESFSSANESSVHASGEYTPAVTPYNAERRLLNMLDGTSFSQAGTRVEWQVEAPADGWYQLGFAYRQEAKTDFPVFCDVYIDGVVPTGAAKAVRFEWADDFSNMTVAAPDGTAQTFFLTEGTHSLALVINAEPLNGVYRTINELITEINDYKTEITRLTGGVSTDRYRDYQLDEYLPDVAGTLLNWAEKTNAALNTTLQYSGGRVSSVFSGLTVCEKQLRNLAKKPGDLPRRLNELSGSASSVSRYLAQTLQDMDGNALSIDKVYLFQSGAELPEQSGFFTRVFESVKRFFLSFTRKEYTASQKNEGSLQVWMARPRQYVELLQSMADTEFAAETGISVDISVMPDQGKLALSAASGDEPDIALSVGYVLPSYLNIRGALLDLKQFGTFPYVAARFPAGLFTPGISEGGVYALPETINFWVLFYRRDIFESLGIPVPGSLDEVKQILPELQRRSMNFYYPTAGMVGMKVFPGTAPFILQSGGSFFGDTIGGTQLDSEASLEGFKTLTDLFTVYDIPTEVPAPGFYQEFRSGTLPIGIADVATYNLLMNAAPELDGLWEIAPFPGIVQPDGSVNRHTTGGAESGVIFAGTEYKAEAWAFMEWWSSGEVQARYGAMLQSLYGGTYLWNTANKEAFAQLPLPASHKSVVLEQTGYMTEVPWVPGTYMIERELSNAYNSVVIDGVSVRRAMDAAVKRIDREVERKLEEFGYTQNGVTVRDFITPDAASVIGGEGAD